MELQFHKSTCACLDWATREVQNQEQTQELKLPDSMPDIGRVLATWGQCVLRSKEWRSNGVSISGGVMTWTLYAPEDGSDPVCIEAWVPFQMKLDFPETDREGTIRTACILRSADARTVSARRMMVRVNVAALVEALEPAEREIWIPGEMPEDVQLLRRTYPLRLSREAGEKTFLLDEELNLPASCPVPEKLISYEIQPEILDQKVMGERIVFRGTANLHMIYQSEEGRLHSCDQEVPFSQLAELDQEYGQDADVQIMPAVTSLELELEEDDRLRLKCGLVAQYVVNDRVMLELVEDAYSPQRKVTISDQPLYLPITLEQRREICQGEQVIPGASGQIVDTSFFTDYPRVTRNGEMAFLEIPGTFQVLYYDNEGNLQSGSVRFEEKKELLVSPNAQLHAFISSNGRPQASVSGNGVNARMDIELNMNTISNQAMNMVTGLDVGELTEPNPARPSLILRRAGDEQLWDLAKQCGTTVDAIRQANQLQTEPVSGQILLIPVP